MQLRTLNSRWCYKGLKELKRFLQHPRFVEYKKKEFKKCIYYKFTILCMETLHIILIYFLDTFSHTYLIFQEKYKENKSNVGATNEIFSSFKINFNTSGVKQLLCLYNVNINIFIYNIYIIYNFIYCSHNQQATAVQ